MYNRSHRLCTWVDPIDKKMHSCIHLDGEFGVCILNKPQYKRRVEADLKFIGRHVDNDYTIEEWTQILCVFEKQLGESCPCDQNISGKEVVELINSGIIK